MKARMLAASLGVIAALLLLAWSCTLIVPETEWVFLGQPRGPALPSGLHLRAPWAEVWRVDRRAALQSVTGEGLSTLANERLLVDYAIAWRVTDPLKFLAATGPAASSVGSRLEAAVSEPLRSACAARSLAQIARGPDATLISPALASARASGAALGIEVLSLQLRRIDLGEQSSAAVYQRIQDALNLEIAHIRGDGAEQAAALKHEGEAHRTEVLSAAARDSERRRGEADARASELYARAYGKNPPFAAFYQSLQIYRDALGRDGDLLLIAPDGEFFRFLKSAGAH